MYMDMRFKGWCLVWITWECGHSLLLWIELQS